MGILKVEAGGDAPVALTLAKEDLAGNRLGDDGAAGHGHSVTSRRVPSDAQDHHQRRKPRHDMPPAIHHHCLLPMDGNTIRNRPIGNQ